MRGPRHVVRKGKTPVLTAEEARTLLDSIPGDTVVGMRDRALIALMVYTFARVGAVIKMRSEDVYVQGRRTWVRLHEKGGKRHEMPCHHSLDTYLAEYIEAAGVGDDPKGWLFRSPRARSGKLNGNPLSQSRRVSDDPPPRARRRHPHADRQSHVSGHRYHRVPAQRRQARIRAAHGESSSPREPPVCMTGGTIRCRWMRWSGY